MSCRAECACMTHVGRVRGNNEDNFCFRDICFDQADVSLAQPLYLNAPLDSGICLAVFDGMGGCDYGEEASAAAAQRFRALTREKIPAEPLDFLEHTAQEANLAVFHRQQELDTHRMGSTMAALCFRRERVYACNVGDSRIFGLRDGKLLQISLDHTDEEFMKQQGITGRAPRLSQYLGMDPNRLRMEPYLTQSTLRDGDLYLICSDGLTDMLSLAQLRDILTRDMPLAETAQTLVYAALNAGGKDNITLILCRIHREDEILEEKDEHRETEYPVAGLEDRTKAWGRKLRLRLRDAARHLRNH